MGKNMIPDSTTLISYWDEAKKTLKRKYYSRWRLAYNAYLMGFVKGCECQKIKINKDMLKEKVRFLMTTPFEPNETLDNVVADETNEVLDILEKE